MGRPGSRESGQTEVRTLTFRAHLWKLHLIQHGPASWRFPAAQKSVSSQKQLQTQEPVGETLHQKESKKGRHQITLEQAVIWGSDLLGLLRLSLLFPSPASVSPLIKKSELLGTSWRERFPLKLSVTRHLPEEDFVAQFLETLHVSESPKEQPCWCSWETH